MMQSRNVKKNAEELIELSFLTAYIFLKLGIGHQEYINKHSSGKSRRKHLHYNEPIFAPTNAYKYSFFPNTTTDWNVLPRDSFFAPDE